MTHPCAAPCPTRVRRLIALTVAAAATTTLAGCGGEGGDTSGTAKDARIRLAMMQPPRSGLTPLSDDAFKLGRWRTAETLVQLDAKGDAQPLLATEWTQRDPMTWVFTVRKGVRFHDDTEMTAQHVAASLTRAAAAKPRPRILDGVQLAVAVEGDAVVLTTAAPDPLVPHRLSSPQLAVLAPQAYEGKAVNPIGTGTGPFRLTDVKGTSGATLERYDGYWGEKAEAPGVDVSFVPDGTARAAALRTGTADLVEAVPSGQIASIDPALVHEVPMPRTNTLYLNTKKGPFTEAPMRAAAREAIDKEGIVTQVYEGRADVAQGLLGPALPWAADLRKDPAYGKTVQARPAAGSGAGKTITIGTFTDRAELPEVAVQVQSALQKKGFEVKLDVREYQYIEADALAGMFDAFILSRATVLDSGDPVAYLTSDFSCKGSFNIAQFCDPGVDALIAKASATAAGDGRRRAVMEAEAAILAQDAAIPMLHERVIQGEASGVKDAVRDPRERELVSVRTTVSR